MTFLRVAQNLAKLEESGTYYARWTVGGRTVRRSLHTTDRKIANARLTELLPRLMTLRPKADNLEFGYVAQLWINHVLGSRDISEATKADRQYHLKAIRKAWPGLATIRVDRITHDDCATWWRQRSSISAQRHNNERDSLEQIFQVAVDRHWILENPAAKLARREIPQPQIIFPSKAEFSAIIKHLEERKNQEAAHCLELLAYGGFRIREAARLKWLDVDIERGVLRVAAATRDTAGKVVGPKNRLGRPVPITPAIRDLLQRIPRVVGRENILRIRQCRDALTKACKELNLPHYTHHDLRRFFTVNMIEAGADIPSVAAILGHLDGGRTLTKWYLRIRPDHLKTVAALGVFTARGSV